MFSGPREIRIENLLTLGHAQDWRRHLAHDLPHHLLVWITRGQGLALMDGLRRGVGAHNAIFVPAGSLFALDLGRQSIATAVSFPAELPIQLPQMPRHLRIRDAATQNELTGLIEAALREQQHVRALQSDALEAHAALLAVWLRRQILLDEHVPEKPAAAGRLSARFCQLIPAQFRSGQPMAAYASQLGVTPTHLTRAVKNATGKTAADLIAERVLYEARHLLSDTNIPARRIAAFLGFGSAPYFTRFIQQHTGQPPSKLRGQTTVSG